MRSEADVRRVFELWAQGMSKKAIARETGVSHTQVRRWLAKGVEVVLGSSMRRTHEPSNDCELVRDVDEPAYAYLLGQYLGDGHISREPNGVRRLRVATCDDYPNIRDECRTAMQAVMPDRKIGLLRQAGSHDVSCYSNHWPCLLPQDGPGRKHKRLIVFEPWQLRIALDIYPDLLLRGLIHSDGWRGTNIAVGRKKRYHYPRYQFSNECKRIRDLFMQACWRVGAECRQSNRVTVSVARRESVALLDSFIGRKT